MSGVGSTQPQDGQRSVVDGVEKGEVSTINVHRRVVGELRGPSTRPQFVSRERFFNSILRQADPGLTAELRELVPDAQDDHG
jgi:hypothetical protein